MSIHVALLRAVNVGGNNRLPMRDLVAMFEAAGARDVRTYIQSGNVVFDAAPRAAPRIVAAVRDAIARDLGLRVPLVLRTAAELHGAAAGNPFLAEEEDRVYVGFLADLPTKAAVAALDPGRSPPDRFVVRGREIYLHLPTGAARTKITVDWLDRNLGTVTTLRNWRTVTKLDAMARGA